MKDGYLRKHKYNQYDDQLGIYLIYYTNVMIKC